MRRRVLLSVALISMSACRGDDATRPILDPASPPSQSISDGNNNQGNPEFFFLPPLVKDPSGSTEWTPGTFNGSLAATVDICELDAATDAQVVTATPCKPGGYATKYQLTSANVSLIDEHYHINWGVPSSAAVFFRISVSVGSVSLGFVDLKTGSSSELKNVNTGELVPMKDGRTLPIKFRIEKYALCEDPNDRTKPCTSKTVNFAEGGTVTNNDPAPSGIDIPAQPGGAVHTITLADCANLNPRATDLPTFDDCLRVTIDPALTAPLAVAATVFNCAVSGTVGEYGTPQARLLAMLQLNEQVAPPQLKALPHADPTCPTSVASVTPSVRGVLAALAHGRVTSAAKQLLAVLAPRPLYAARFIDLGGGGFTHFADDGGQGGLNSVSTIGGARLSLSAALPATTIRDFQLALPAKFEVSATPTDRTEQPGSTIAVSVKVTDLDGAPVPNARVRFQPSAGSSVNAAVIEGTGIDGIATVQWTLSNTAGTNTLVASGRGIAGPDVNGPREGTDPFQPLHTEWGDATNATAPVVVSTGSMTVTATGRNATGTISGTLINAFTNTPIAGATVTASPSATGMATDLINVAPVSAVTGSNGAFLIEQVIEGTYDVTTSAAGFVNAVRSGVVVVAGANTALGTLSTPPVTAEGSIRIVLDWGACRFNNPIGGAPCDLDSHLTGPTSTSSRFHVFYAFLQFSDAASAAQLDLDDVTGLGPETITLSRQTVAGVYRYYVHNYSGEAALSASGGRVRVFFGASPTPAATFDVPVTGSGRYWEVFALTGSTITPINMIRATEPPNSSTLSQSSVAAAGLSPTSTRSSTSSSSTLDNEIARIDGDVRQAVKQP